MILENKTRLLLILSQDVLDQARVIAGKATTALKLPVSLQIVLRALIWVGLKRESHPALLPTSRARPGPFARSGAERVAQVKASSCGLEVTRWRDYRRASVRDSPRRGRC